MLCLKVFVPKGEMLLLGGTTTIPLYWKLRLPPDHFEFLTPLNQQTKRGVMVLGAVTDPDYQGEVELLFHMEIRKSMPGM